MVQQHPDWDDERIYQTVKLVMGAKVALIGNSYQMAYWSAPYSLDSLLS
jgi:peroxidase